MGIDHPLDRPVSIECSTGGQGITCCSSFLTG